MRLAELEFDQIPCWGGDSVQRAWPAFLASCECLAHGNPSLRAAVSASLSLTTVARAALEAGAASDAERFFQIHFQPWLVRPDGETSRGFFTGYYEPEIDGSPVRTGRFQAPVLSRPTDLQDMRASNAPGWDHACESARVTPDGRLEPYPDRRAIEAGRIDHVAQPVVWLEDHVEVFFVQVQGSACIRFPDGTRRRLIYSGRNGQPYSSIGKILIDRREIAPEEMSLDRCKTWLRQHGLETGQPGREVLQSNRSYIFFRLAEVVNEAAGPIGGQGIALTAGCSIAIDRTVWPYGTPVFVAGDFSSAGMGRAPLGAMMVAQDTGSAIKGPARGDLFIGSGHAAGEIAGKIRHSGDFIAFLPRRS